MDKRIDKKLIDMKRFLSFLAMALIIPAMAYAGTGKVLKIDFSSPVVENSSGMQFDISSLLGGGSSAAPVTLLSYVRAIDAAAQDKNIRMIYMTPDKISAGMSQVEEIRAALERFRASGKEIVCYCSNFSNLTYYLASVADKVILDPASESMVLGLATRQFFLKDILDALEIEVQLIRHGKYKSAGEMYIRNSSSPENRQQNQEMIDAIWDGWSTQIAASRGISASDFNSWIDNLELVLPQDYKDRGLIDEIWYRDQVDEYICGQYGVDDIKLVRYVKLAKYADKLKKGKRKNRIAVIYADGEIVMEGSSDNIVGPKLAATIEKVRKDRKVKAVVFRVNSPGGSAQAAESIRRSIEMLKKDKPVIVSFGDYAASGGYWISAAGDRIYTNDCTLTGSIGVFSIVPSFGNALRKNLKVNMETQGTSAHSDMITGVRRLDDTEVEYFQKSVEDIYDQFTTIVSDGRGMAKDRVDELGQGRVWAGSEALKNGLADVRGGLVDALAYAAEKAGLEAGEYRVNSYPEAKDVNLMSLLMGSEVPDPDETATSHVQENAVLEELFPAVSFIREMSQPQNMLRMESVIEFK